MRTVLHCWPLVLAILLSACATDGPPAPLGDPELTALEYSDQFDFLDTNDPLEPLNRSVYRLNARFDDFVYLPALRVYRAVLPDLVETGVANFFSNLNDIPVLANLLLQARPKPSLKTAGRLLLNTTVGIGGLWDPATRVGLPKTHEDFGQTLGHYGVAPGPYLVLPVLGPSSLRDGLGFVVDRVIRAQVDLFGFDSAQYDYPPLLLLEVLDQRRANSFRYGEFGSPFEYDLVRFFYLKKRALEVAN